MFTCDWTQQLFNCVGDCAATETISVPAGCYIVFAKYFTAGWQPICEKSANVTVGGSDPCAGQGGDSDGDGVCNNQDCEPFDAFFPNTPGTPCNDGNPNTNNDMVTADGCDCKGTIGDPCANQGGDSDGDGVCNNQDCEPFDAFFPNTPGTPCNDGNPNTTNDMVTADGCSCAGTPGGGDPDCEQDISITTNATSIIVSGLDGAPVSSVQVFTSDWSQQLFNCAGDCAATETIPVPAGDYIVFAKYFTAGWQPICEKEANVTVGGGDPCANQSGDSDGDVVCNNQDCEPFDAFFPNTPGTPCNDGNPNTTNDVVTADGCNCQGTVGDPCANQGGDSDGDGVCNNQDCEPFDAFFPNTPGIPCNDGNPNTNNDMVTADGCSCAGTPGGGDPDCEQDINISTGNGTIIVSGLDGAPVSSVKVFNSSWGIEFECTANCNATETINVIDGTYHVSAKYFTAGWQPICEKTADVTVGGSNPCANQGGDSDGDGVCNNQDCKPFDAFFPNTPGTPCNDGNPNTTNDMVTADGCDCAGTPIGGGCDNVNFGGKIGFGGSCAGSFEICDANGGTGPVLGNCNSPSGGSGAMEIIWLRNSQNCNPIGVTIEQLINDPNSSPWEIVPGATSLSYNPGFVSTTTCYQRCARRAGCTQYLGESNLVQISVNPNCGGGGIDCSNINISTSPGNISVSGLNNAPVSSVQVFTSDWLQVMFNCAGTCGATANIPVGAGTYIVLVKYFNENWVPQCEVTQNVAVANAFLSNSQFDFQVAKEDEHAEIFWLHNKGERVSTYTVEHSTNGIDFSDLDNQPSKGGTSVKTYQSFDLSPAKGDNYYRIKMDLTDGTTEYSIIKKIHYDDLIDFILFPNPANEFTKMNLESIVGKEDVKFSIYNTLGVMVQEFELEKVNAKYHQMDLRDLKEGHYIIRMNVQGHKPIAKQLVVGKI